MGGAEDRERDEGDVGEGADGVFCVLCNALVVVLVLGGGGGSVGESVAEFVGESVAEFVAESVAESVGESVGGSEGGSVEVVDVASGDGNGNENVTPPPLSVMVVIRMVVVWRLPWPRRPPNPPARLQGIKLQCVCMSAEGILTLR